MADCRVGHLTLQMISVLILDRSRSYKPRIALDAHAEGLTYQDTARRIYGPDLVDEMWSDINRVLKNRTIRAVQRGHRLIAGEYLKLLA